MMSSVRSAADDSHDQTLTIRHGTQLQLMKPGLHFPRGDQIPFRNRAYRSRPPPSSAFRVVFSERRIVNRIRPCLAVLRTPILFRMSTNDHPTSPALHRRSRHRARSPCFTRAPDRTLFKKCLAHPAHLDRQRSGLCTRSMWPALSDPKRRWKSFL
jgi:hypothetical protein